MSKNETLLVIDVQRVNMEPNPQVTSDGDDLIPKCRGLIDKARAASVPVVYVQHLSEDQPDDPALVAVHPDIAPAPGEPVIPKWYGSAFFKTDLTATLEKTNADTLYISGLSTLGCINATVMCALCKDYDVRVVLDAHGSASFPDMPAEKIIEIFNKTWKQAGATLIRANDVIFTS